jgi:tRNA wybutosine-synthesizing protein 3
MTVFDQRKRHILDDLQSNEPDLSPKGKPDDEIVGLLELINACEDYVSTSSCSGRVVVFLDADKVEEGEDTSGRWLMTRHTQFEGSMENSTIEELFAMLFGHLNIGSDWESNGQSPRLITLKFEPLVQEHSASPLIL